MKKGIKKVLSVILSMVMVVGLIGIVNPKQVEASQNDLVENGTFDKLKRYYAGDEKPLRDDGNIFTTSLSFSVNCTKRRLRVKFWENPNCILYYQW